MPKMIILISGNVGIGKSTLSSGLKRTYGASIVKTKEVLSELYESENRAPIPRERKVMQDYGQELDNETEGAWVRDAVKRHIAHNNLGDSGVLVVDAVRILNQIKEIRKSYQHIVKHIHLEASPKELERRYSTRPQDVKELSTYSQVQRDRTEARVKELRNSADFVIDTERCTPDDVVIKVATYCGLVTRDYARLVDVYVGGQFGSEGKGHIISYVAREYDVLVRVGGPNAGHKVFMQNGVMTHRQLPSGTMRSEAPLLIGPGAVLNLELLLEEITKCQVSSERLSIDPQAMIISAEDINAEGNLAKTIGSTKQGVGFATARRITNRAKSTRLAKDFKELKPYIRETWEQLEKAYSDGARILLEGTQGTGLSIFHGTFPFVTSRDTCVAGCLSEAGIAPSRVRKVVMVCRSLPIRVASPRRGDSGPIGREISWRVVSDRCRIPVETLEKTERGSVSGNLRRVAEFNWALLRKAAALNGPTDIALTFADYLHEKNKDARRYEQLDTEDILFIEQIERVAAAPVSLISTRFDFRSIIDRRAW